MRAWSEQAGCYVNYDVVWDGTIGKAVEPSEANADPDRAAMVIRAWQQRESLFGSPFDGKGSLLSTKDMKTAKNVEPPDMGWRTRDGNTVKPIPAKDLCRRCKVHRVTKDAQRRGWTICEECKKRKLAA